MTRPRTLPHNTTPTQPVEAYRFPDPIPGYISFGSVNFLAGASGVGKTCLISWMLTQFRDAKPIFGHPINRPVAIGYIAADRDWDTANYWLMKVRYPDLAHYSLVDDLAFNPTRLKNKLQLIPILGECLDKLALPPGSLVVVDPAALFISNLNDYHACAVACLEMRRLCKARGLTLIGLSHAGKQKSDTKERYLRLQDRINGSGAQLAYGDTQMFLAAPAETGQKHYTFLWHPHRAKAEEFPLGQDSEGLFVPWEDSLMAEQENAVYACLPLDGTIITLAAIQAVCGQSDATVFRKLKELTEEGRVEKAAPGQYRRLPLH